MATRKRRPELQNSSSNRRQNRELLRRSLLERLEHRHLMAAGPQLIGIQPNDGALIENNVTRDVAPRLLTFRFDDGQQIHPDTLDAIRITRAGEDGKLDTADDVRIVPGSLEVGNPAGNEVVVRFADSLPDDRYRIEVFAFDDPSQGIVGLRNTTGAGLPGDLLQPRTAGQRKETREFDLRLGALVESIVPQPVVRLSNGTLQQKRDQVVVYFNEPLFVEHDPTTGLPTDRSADNPRFYQLLFTRDTVRNTDDVLFLPVTVDYRADSMTATLTFAKDLEKLIRENVVDGGVAGGTYRLRVGSAVNIPAGADGTLGVPTFNSSNPGDSVDLFFEPDTSREFVASANSTLRTMGDGSVSVKFSNAVGVSGTKWNQVRFVDSGVGGLTVSVTDEGSYSDIVLDLGGTLPSVANVVDLLNTDAATSVLLQAVVTSGLASNPVGTGLPAMEPIRLLSDSFATAYQVDTFGGDQVTSLLFSEAISSIPYTLEFAGGPNDPSSRDLVGRNAGIFGQYINSSFSVDFKNQIKLISYNFGPPGAGLVNSITDQQKQRVREALDLWSQYIGVRFVETTSDGWTIALETPTSVPAANRLLFNNNRAAVVPDATFNDGTLVLDALFDWDVGYGEDFFRSSFAGIGALLGLGRASDLPSSTVMALSNAFLNDTINQSLQQQVYEQVGNEFNSRPLEPVFPGNYDVQHAEYLHGASGSDIDLYRFEVNIATGANTGILTAETYAQRLADSSALDTSIKLYQQVQASFETNFSLPVAPIKIEALAAGRLGNQTQIDYLRSFRAYVPPSDSITGNAETARQLANAAAFEIIIVQTGVNSFTVDLPYLPDLGLLTDAQRAEETERLAKTPADILKAINLDPFASTLVRAVDVHGDNFASLDDWETFASVFNLPELPFQRMVLSGGDIVPIAYNNDYFGTDSRIQLQLGDGVYYIGVSAAGNEAYDATIQGSGFGGRSEGDYQLFVKFEASADGRDVIRDLDAGQAGVPGTPLDGDGDGTPGGVNNFWFQVRPVNRQLEFDSGATIIPGQTMSIVSGTNGTARTYQFILVDAFDNVVPGQPPLGNGRIAVRYRNNAPANQIAQLVASVVNSQTPTTQVQAIPGTGTLGARIVTLTGERSVTFNDGFEGVTVLGRTIFVDKAAGSFPDGTSNKPFNNIASASVSSAFPATHPGDIVRIVGNGGNDGKTETSIDNFAYRIGVSETGGAPLEDGITMDVPEGVTVMVDAGAVFKMRNSRVGVGSSNLQIDRSGAALQILGTPRLLSATGNLIVSAGVPASGKVVFTSSRDTTVSQPLPSNLQPGMGDWGGLEFRRDVDDQFGRSNLEDQGIFLQYVNYADIRYGGGSNVLVDADQVTVSPIQIVDTQPTITFNRISNSADAAMSAAPNSFAEVSYQAPRYQAPGIFTADYDRVGPDIRRNLLSNNTLNGLFIRVETESGAPPVVQTISARWDDIDIVHILSENLVLSGAAGGAIRDEFSPAINLVTLAVNADSGRVDSGVYTYRMTMVDAFGFESLASNPTPALTVPSSNSHIKLSGLSQVAQDSEYQFRRLYRSLNGGDFQLVAELNAIDTTYTDRLNQTAATSVLDLTRTGERGRPAASLVIDANSVVKIQGSRIEVGFGAQLLAEGMQGEEVIFTSIQDDRYGAGGSFDTNNDGSSVNSGLTPSAGDWAGIYGSPTSHVSIDHAVLAYGGGLSRIEGTFKAFNVLELQQATARITNSSFENNANGIGGQGPTGRFGRLANTPATIFVRGSQPTVVGNSFVGNGGSVIDIDVNSFNADLNVDAGRQSGVIDLIVGLDDNRGPLVRRNALDDNGLNGMEIRGETLTTESVWDDTDIVHVLYDSVVVDNFHGSGGLRLQSNPNESLVVKLLGPGSPFNDTTGTGFTITGTENDLQDRTGGSVQVMGRPGFPVVMTSLLDDSVGAGRKPDGTQQSDTNNDAFATRPSPNDWRSLFLDQTSNDRNVAVVRELELQTDQAPGINGSSSNAQVLGELAGRIVEGDDLRRIAFDVEGFLSAPNDADTYQFRGEAGSEVWIDIDRTTSSLDTVLELLDANGVVLARSVNSYDESLDASTIDVFSNQLNGLVGSLAKGPKELQPQSSAGEYADFSSTNSHDAGMRLILPGAVGSRGPYFIRVRSNSVNPNDTAGGLTSGSYRFQIRLQEEQEIAGSSVTYADIRYANHGIHTKGLPGESPLLGEAQENEGVSATSSNNSINQSATTPGSRPQYLGNLLAANDRTISVGGALSGANDIDFYRVTLTTPNSGATAGGVIAPTVFDIDYADGISRPDTNLAVYYSASGNAGNAQLVLFSQGSNVSEDRTGFLSSLSEDIFAAGSTGAGDPFIGPVGLPQGTYFVAVTQGSSIPTALNNPLSVRREPVDSVRRLIEERFYVGGDLIVRTTADAPVVSQLFDLLALPAGWSLDTSRGGDTGHGIQAAFDGSRPANPGGRSLHFNPAAGVPNSSNSVESNTFSLEGYAAGDLPTIYFNYLLDGAAGDSVRINVVTPAGTTTIASSAGAGANLINDPADRWRQLRVDLSAFAGQSDLTLEVVYQTGGTTTGEGFYIDDIVVGFAERGEMIIGAAPGDATFGGAGVGGVASGAYQLEMRPGTQYFTPNPSPGRLISLQESYDTNDRHATAVTIVAPAGADLVDGYSFQLGDGSRMLTFEFDELTAAMPSGNGVQFGNIRIPFRALDSSAKVASALRTAINQAVAQNGLRISASTASGLTGLSPSDARINLYGSVVGDFVSTAESTVPVVSNPAQPNRIRIPATFFNGIGDKNAERAQGQILIDSNYISDTKVYGIWSDPGDSLIDPMDDSTNPFLENLGLHSPALGAVRNLPTVNDSVVGGLAPGLVIQNNVIDRPGYVGIQVQGQQRPLMFEGSADFFNPELTEITDANHFYFGARIADGIAFAIDVAGTRVVFEFEDISGATIPSGGSGQVGGDGWVAGHVPVYYRKGNDAAPPYNPGPPSTQRIYPYTRMEVMHAIRDSIIGSILVTNDLIPLVDVWVGQSLLLDPAGTDFFGLTGMSYATPTLFINGASGIYFTTQYAKQPSNPIQIVAAPVQQAVQPFARIINNTLYGSDGTESNSPVGGLAEPSDNLAKAVDTKMGTSHTTTPYFTTGRIGDGANVDPTQDVDLYRFHLDVGDRAKINVSTLDLGPNVTLRLFNGKGELQTFTDGTGATVDIVRSGASPASAVIDFTSLEAGSYYLGVSSTGNENYDPRSFADRVTGTGGTGDYTFSLEVLAPRQFVLSLQQVLNFDNLVGTTFTIEQVADLAGTNVNSRTFEFVLGGGAAAAGNIPIFILGGNSYRTGDVMRAIAAAINSTINGIAVLPNNENQNGPQGVSGPVTRVEATALGGGQGWDGNSGLSVYNGGLKPLRSHAFGPGAFDAPSGFGHNRTAQVNSVGIAGTTTDGAGTTENYVLIKNASRVIINGVPNLGLDPQPGSNMDQLLPEVGIMARDGASPSLMNNIIDNFQAAVETEVTRQRGFGGTRGPNLHTKQGQVIVGGSIFQHTETRQGLFQSRMQWPNANGAGTETDAANLPSNVNGGTSDFNLLLPGSQVLLVDPSSDDFLPITSSIAIDSSINSLAERDAFASLKRALGLPVNPLLAPSRDVTGQLRVDDPNVSFSGLGSNVFKDRGAVERADFVGPVAVIINPFDNDSPGVDRDPNVSFVQINQGIVSEFRIQLRDSGDASDPFQGSGVDDGTVVGPSRTGIRAPGATVTVFENGKLLEEGIDYLFSYDQTNNVITLRPLAGIWRQESVYEIGLNNKDRFVVTAPAGTQISDGDQFIVNDSAGGKVTFEYDTGYQLAMPEVISLTAPVPGAGLTGVVDGDRITIKEGNRTVTFEYTTDINSIVANNVPVLFTVDDSPLELVTALRDAIEAQIANGTLTANIQGVGVRPIVTTLIDAEGKLRIGMEAGGIVDASKSNLVQAARTIAFQVPLVGTGTNGIQDGHTFVIGDGNQQLTFEFNRTDGPPGTATVSGTNIVVDITGVSQPTDIVRAIRVAIDSTDLGVQTSAVGNDLLYLGLPDNGTAFSTRGPLAAVSLARTLSDAGTLTLTPAGGVAETIEFNRTDEYSGNDGVAGGNTAVNFARTASANELAFLVSNALKSIPSLGLSPQTPGSGLVLVGGDSTLGLATNGTAGLDLTGIPGVASNSTLRIPAILELVSPAGNSYFDGTEFTITIGANAVTFVFNSTGLPVPGKTQITFAANDSSDVMAGKIIAAINASTLGITALPLGNGRISLGELPASAVSIPVGSPLISNPGRVAITDGETISILHGGQTLVFEFEQANGGGGVANGATEILFSDATTAIGLGDALAAAITARGAIVGLSATSLGNGSVRLADRATTRVNISLAPSLELSGVPGGAVAIPFVQASSFSSEDVKLSAIAAINAANAAGKTTLRASERGGNTFFIENAVSIEGPVQSYFLSAIKDVVGQPLKPNREDGSTRFTLMLPTVAFDFGDAPDPQSTVRGRYPTLIASDGARHVFGVGPKLGATVDPEFDGQPLASARGDDTAAFVVGTPGATFTSALVNGNLTVTIANAAVDGQTIRLSTISGTVTFELDNNDIFSEDNIPVRFKSTDSAATVARALRDAIANSSLRVATANSVSNVVEIITNDDDGVTFTSSTNPFGVFNPNIPTQITVTVTGGGFLDGWVDFNSDGDWDDPGEQIFTNVLFDPLEPTRTFAISMPSTTPLPPNAIDSYARFRVSSTGNLRPSGLAIDGEVEDYRVRIVPGTPPTIPSTTLNYSVDENQRLIGLDQTGANTPTTNDNGLLAGVVDADGDLVEIYPTPGVDGEYQVIGIGSTKVTIDGKVGSQVGGVINVSADGRFTFDPGDPDDATDPGRDFFGDIVFRYRVTDRHGPGQEDLDLVATQLVTVTITVNPVNDAPFLIPGASPTTTVTDSPEDQVVVFDGQTLISGRFVAGPANEVAAGQTMRVQSAGFGATPNVTRRGGTLQVTSAGNIVYTPPTDFSGPGTDEFTYTIVDEPGPGQSAQQATSLGTVVISFVAVNDPPTANPNSYGVNEDTQLVIPLTGLNGLLTNDVPGPADEVAAGQVVSLVPGQFPLQTVRGGTVELSADGTTLLYTPRLNFAGSDSFQYAITDNAPVGAATAMGTVTINVVGTNDGAEFAGPTTLTFNESKGTPQEFTYDLNTWFTDPESDPLTYQVQSADGTLINATLNGNLLKLVLPLDRSGNTSITVTAFNPGNLLPVTQIIPVTVINTPDPPRVIASLNPTNTNEDQNVIRDLTQYFFDPDGDVLTYSVVTPTGQSQPFNRNLVESVTFNGDQMQITLVPNANGSTPITIRVSDGTFAITETFTLAVAPVADVPVGRNDSYQVPIRGRLIIVDPRVGVLANDTEADGDAVTVNVASVTQPANGQVTMNANGTFTYVNLANSVVGAVDTFTYRAVDKDGVSNVVTVSITLIGSTHQNPSNRLDVNADGSVSPIDALRIINLLNRENKASIPIRDLPAPPDYYDTDGNGNVVPLDALAIINYLNRVRGSGEGEGVSQDLRFATSTSWVSAGTANLPLTGFVPSPNRGTPADGEGDNFVGPRLPSTQWQMVDGRIDDAVTGLLDTLYTGRTDDDQSTDAALVDLLSEFDFSSFSE